MRSAGIRRDKQSFREIVQVSEGSHPYSNRMTGSFSRFPLFLHGGARSGAAGSDGEAKARGGQDQ
jgi:hypothetical protein